MSKLRSLRDFKGQKQVLTSETDQKDRLKRPIPSLFKIKVFISKNV